MPKEDIFAQGKKEIIGDPPSSLDIISDHIEIIPQEAESSRNHPKIPAIPASLPSFLYSLLSLSISCNPFLFYSYSYCYGIHCGAEQPVMARWNPDLNSDKATNIPPEEDALPDLKLFLHNEGESFFQHEFRFHVIP
ncbi:hypothetical protein TIFTF001_036033 [Ficus carica]|uniref:Uncharacterized protein n=1 Tax=Ficus carica TaxID=3494 RepID=A0AA88E3J6_FICCA|nr:hypothetical protein TIFTF001_036033 [Ficus carica]